MDRNLTWKPHIQDLKKKCTSDVKLLRTLSKIHWGAEFKVLRTLYTALILPKLNYGSFLYDTAAKSNLAILDSIQNHALRTMLGSLRCTRIEHMQVLANIPPLYINRKIQLFDYSARTMAISSNPIWIIIRNSHINPNDSTIKIDPITTRIIKDFKKLPINLIDNIANYPYELKSKSYPPIAYSDICITKKQNLNNQSWNILHKCLLDSYHDYKFIYCDGSVQNERSACGIWSESFTLKARLPNHSSILTCELYAIYIATKYIQNIHSIQKYLILTDSLSAVETLKSPHLSKHHLTLKIAEIITAYPQKRIDIQWIPSHMDIPGNDLADKIAKESLNLNIVSKCKYTATEAIRIIKKHFLDQFLKPVPHALTQLTSFSPQDYPFPFLFTPRHVQAALTRIHLEVTFLTHIHIITNNPPNECPNCNITQSIYHILIICPAFASHRKTIQDYCAAQNMQFCLNSILNGKLPPTVLYNFLKETNILKLV